jgi:hypothetical protein
MKTSGRTVEMQRVCREHLAGEAAQWRQPLPGTRRSR